MLRKALHKLLTGENRFPPAQFQFLNPSLHGTLADSPVLLLIPPTFSITSLFPVGGKVDALYHEVALCYTPILSFPSSFEHAPSQYFSADAAQSTA